MVEAEDDKVIVDDVERMPNLSGISDSRNVLEMRPVFAQKSYESWSCLVPESEDYSLVHVPLGRIAGDSPKDRKSAGRHLLDRAEIALFQIRPDPFLRRCQVQDVPLHVTLRAEGDIDKSSAPADSFR